MLNVWQYTKRSRLIFPIPPSPFSLFFSSAWTKRWFIICTIVLITIHVKPYHRIYYAQLQLTAKSSWSRG